jgi:hypothetical protein
MTRYLADPRYCFFLTGGERTEQLSSIESSREYQDLGKSSPRQGTTQPFSLTAAPFS